MSLFELTKIFEKLPPLERSQKVQEVIDRETNFGYDEMHDIMQDLNDEIEELKEELIKHSDKNDNTQRIFEELGDVLFVIGNLANRYKVNSADALTYSINEFLRRMFYCEEHYNGVDLKTAPKETMVKLWKEDKKNK